eukprot:1827437-Rhodomonas_salina.1
MLACAHQAPPPRHTQRLRICAPSLHTRGGRKRGRREGEEVGMERREGREGEEGGMPGGMKEEGGGQREREEEGGEREDLRESFTGDLAQLLSSRGRAG